MYLDFHQNQNLTNMNICINASNMIIEFSHKLNNDIKRCVNILPSFVLKYQTLRNLTIISVHILFYISGFLFYFLINF